MKEEKKHLTIQELAGIVGVSTSALRAWERRYSIFSPERTTGGHRLYTQEDLKLFWFVMHLRGKGNDLKQIANQGREDLLKQASAFFDLSAPQKHEPSVELLAQEKKQLPVPFHSILDALKKDDVEAAIRALEQVYALSDSALSFADSALDLMVEVGEHWHQGAITVAAEHALTARLKHMLLGLFYLNNGESASPDKAQPLVVCATLPHELHELGLLRVALYLKHWGFRVTYLGANTPIVDVEEYCMRRKPTLVVVSCASSLNITSMIHSLQKLSVLVAPHSPVVVGGSGIKAIENQKLDLKGLVFLKNLSNLEQIAHECKQNQNLSAEDLHKHLALKLGQ
ncbi:MAG: MerR family transcriptional regulator [Betaproteobacteria bacterium]|nr:MerR family transcriptional regulator [Betaproteobacteria bacterium]